MFLTEILYEGSKLYGVNKSLNKLFIIWTTVLLVGGFVVTQVFAKSSVARPRVLGESAEEGEEEVQQKEVHSLDLFSDPKFLKIQESLFGKTVPFISTQEEVSVQIGLLPPQNVQIWDSKNGKVVTITWDKFLVPPAEVLIFRTTVAGNKPDLIGTVSGENLSYYDTDIEVGKIYYYTLVNKDKENNISTKTGPYKIGPIEDVTLPDSPSNIVVILEDDKVLITWEDPVGSDLSHINIYRSKIKGEIGKKIAEAELGAGEFEDSNINNGDTYYYLVTSQDMAGNESPYNMLGSRLGNPNPFTPLF